MSWGLNYRLAEGRDGEWLLNLTLDIGAGALAPGWTLHLDLPRAVASGEGTHLQRQTGSHLVLAPEDTEQRTLQLSLLADSLQRLSDLPAAPYLAWKDSVEELEVLGDNLLDFLGAETSAVTGSAPGEARVRHTLLPAPRQFTEREGELPLQLPLSIQDAPAVFNLARGYLEREGILTDTSGVTRLKLGSLSGEPESYRLTIDEQGIEIRADDPAGFFYAAVSLAQLIAGKERIPCCDIEDAPRFGYRGFMLDCARHFHSPGEIRKLLDCAARFKLNRFHWHLTDDEGWRLEIRAFPELTQIGAWRGHSEAMPSQYGSGPSRYGGFYSQQDVADIIDYAASLNITVIPEIDIPGHSRAAICALPTLLTEPGDESDYCSVQYYRDNVLNPGIAGTYEFLDTVLAEVCELFPGPWVHMGADEVPEGVWEKSPACQALMAREGYGSSRELQGHLLRHAQRFLEERERTLMGWEEAAEGDKLEKSALICAWTSVDSTAHIAGKGYPVIACPAPQTYHDLAWNSDPEEPGLYWAGTADLKACYEYQPDTASGQVLGVQAQLWSELLSSEERLEYMLFPRLLATAETAWCAAAKDDWPGFYARVKDQLVWLAARGVNSRPL